MGHAVVDDGGKREDIVMPLVYFFLRSFRLRLKNKPIPRSSNALQEAPMAIPAFAPVERAPEDVVEGFDVEELDDEVVVVAAALLEDLDKVTFDVNDFEAGEVELEVADAVLEA